MTGYMECLYPGDSRVTLMLGRQPAPAEGASLRVSRFVFPLVTDDEQVLFHTLTRQMVTVPLDIIDCNNNAGRYPAALLEDKYWAELYERWFLVPEEYSESEAYLQMKQELILREERPEGISGYVILPTTACNARCFYCFEQGMEARKMSPETVEDTLRFILEHRPEGRGIHIHWFGGEPLCAADVIDRICQGLREAGVEYTAEMTSNGSLFTAELARKAAEAWHVRSVQVSLDGRAEEYARRKRYESLRNPYGTVIRNIHRLLNEGIRGTVRLNLDEENAEEIFRTASAIKTMFSASELKGMRVYAHALHGGAGVTLDGCPVFGSADALEEKAEAVNEYLLRKGITAFDPGKLFTLKIRHCMAEDPEHSVLIDSAGRLHTCEAMADYTRYGNVKEGIDPDAFVKAAAPCPVREECRGCVFLPQCTEFDRCPNRQAYGDCYRQEKRKLENRMRIAREIIREGRKEAGHVPD